jgi:outer membrane cobalamin receptor
MTARSSSPNCRSRLFRDSFLGEYAELSGSYRYADYSTVGSDVYGVNLVYRPIPDITFKTSYNTSIRVPDLGENFSPLGETFANGIVDPCTTANIAAVNDAETRTTGSGTVRLWRPPRA